MKQALFIFGIIILFLIVGTLVLYPLNDWYWNFKGYEGGYDDEMRMLDLLLYIEWPILIIIGGVSGYFLHKKYLTNRSTTDVQKRRAR